MYKRLEQNHDQQEFSTHLFRFCSAPSSLLSNNIFYDVFEHCSEHFLHCQAEYPQAYWQREPWRCSNQQWLKGRTMGLIHLQDKRWRRSSGKSITTNMSKYNTVSRYEIQWVRRFPIALGAVIYSKAHILYPGEPKLTNPPKTQQIWTMSSPLVSIARRVHGFLVGMCMKMERINSLRAVQEEAKYPLAIIPVPIMSFSIESLYLFIK